MSAPSLTPAMIKRLERIERANRYRAKRMGCRAEPVDFIAVLHRQGWVCAITGVALDPSLPPSDTRSISLDHHNPLSNDGAHDWGNVRGTTLGANIEKGRREDKPRSDKRKRQAKKVGVDRATAREAKSQMRSKAGKRLQSRPFQTNRNSPWKRLVDGQTVRRDR